MLYLLFAIFVIGYLGIVLEHNIDIDKSASALLTGALCWVVVTVIMHDPDHVNEELYHHLSEIASILFFLMGAMTIVELIDTYDGFDIITDRITTNSQTLSLGQTLVYIALCLSEIINEPPTEEMFYINFLNFIIFLY